MSDALARARAALAAAEAEVGDTDMDNLGHLRAALAEVDRVVGERDAAFAYAAAYIRGVSISLPIDVWRGTRKDLVAAFARKLADEVGRLTGPCAPAYLFSTRAALDRVGAPTRSPEGAPVSDEWRAKWACEQLERARAILACERGEWAPSGWRWDRTQGICRHADGTVYVSHNDTLGWFWHAGSEGMGTAPTALEAIEAADRAREGSRG